VSGRQSSSQKPVHIGCSGWNYKHWRERIYPAGLPAKRWLEYYAQLFNTVEVNSTFYRLASEKAVHEWVRQTPEQFVFAVKASRYLTHVKRLTNVETGINRFYEPLQALVKEGKLGPVLWQLPESFRRADDRLTGLLAALPPGRHCVEFRHPSWFSDDVYKLLSEHNVALVVADHPDREFGSPVLTADWTFVRFHQGEQDDGSYSHKQLRRWADQISEWREGAEVYAYFNNDQFGSAVDNGQALKELLGI
jgi:uncharacterized protein YecE (DUF72 family)